MIGYLKGTVVFSQEREIIILTDGGTGYLVSVTPQVAAAQSQGDIVELFIETSVREDAIVLFGFPKMEERKLFNLLREVNKIGPKTALSILSSGTAEEIGFAIASGNAGFFKKISGVGQKTAERIIIDLKEKWVTSLLKGAERSLLIQTETLSMHRKGFLPLDTILFR
ncbi:MAG TPA: Holliday junction ATP-dependent DNA helicase RuvA [bacterium]|mgnify:CR=1 FL=1|nr:Holliday junction ATP-dependent DNA helicase RuvA [bacterium]